ncbi:MAG: hypothetical protein ABIJ61_04120 [bacterium]
MAAVVQRGDGLEYLLAAVEADKLYLQRAGHLDWAELQTRDHPLLGRRLICGLGHGSYAVRRLQVSREIARDREQLDWELSRGLTETYDKYHQSVMQLTGQSVEELLVLSAKRRAVERLGARLAKYGLALDQLAFEPEALYYSCRALGGETRTLLLLIEPERAQLLLIVQRQLVAFNTLSLRRTEAHALMSLVEDIGTVLLATPYGRTVDRRLNLILAGDPKASGLADAFTRALPYEINLIELDPQTLNLECSTELATEFARWLLPISLAHLYHENRLCASSPANDAASH